MNKKWLINQVKHSKLIYSIYFFLGNFALRLLNCFIKTNDKVILFVSFGGKKFDDSPRAIYEKMIEDSRFNGYEFVWAFLHPENYNISVGKKLKIDSLSYYVYAISARVWITNNSVERGLSFKRKKTFYFNTWHGSAIKKMGIDIPGSSQSFKTKSNNKADVMTAQSQYDIEIFSRVFNIEKDRFKVIGLPRNDRLVKNINIKDCVVEKLKLDNSKKIILYAPTYREYDFDSNGNIFDIPINLKRWEEVLSDQYVLLIRAHHAVSKKLSIIDNSFVKDVSNYPVLDELMLASDLLISDYSSIFFDYSIMCKPMICFCYDYEKYEKERGLYFDIREWLPNADNETELLKLLMNFDRESSINRTLLFRTNYVTAYGNATEKSLDIIAKELINN